MHRAHGKRKNNKTGRAQFIVPGMDRRQKKKDGFPFSREWQNKNTGMTEMRAYAIRPYKVNKRGGAHEQNN